MTEELSPEFLKFSEMLDADPESVGPEHSDDAALLNALGDALRDEPGVSPLPSNFAQDLAADVVARFESLPPGTKRLLWLESQLLSPVGMIRVLKTVPAVSGLALLSWFLPHLLLPFGLVLLGGCGLWAARYWVERDVWGLGRHDFTRALYLRLTLTLPLLAASALIAQGTWSLSGTMNAGLDTRVLTSLSSLVFAVPVLYWLGKALKASVIQAARPKVAFLLLQALSLALLVLGTTYTVPWAGKHWVLMVGSMLGCTVLLALLAFRFDSSYLSFEHHGLRVPILMSKFIFYLLPATNALLSGLCLGALVQALGFLSVSFRSNMEALYPLSMFIALSVTFLVISASFRYWEAVLAESKKRPLIAPLFQSVQVVWLCGIASLAIGGLPTHGHQYASILTSVAFLSSVVALLAVVIAHRSRNVFTSRLQVVEARKRGMRSLLFGAIPILASLVVFYQLNLTREIYDPAYKSVKESVQTWVESQQAIPAEQNGWTLVAPYLLRDSLQKPENEAVHTDFKALGKFNQGHSNDYLSLKAAGSLPDYEKSKERFLKRLPLIEESLSRPYFSSTATQGLSMDSYVPDYIAIRAMTQGFGLLIEEATAKRDHEAALRYGTLSLKWSVADPPQSLIGLMIRIALLSITHSKLESAVIQGVFDERELAALASALRKARPDSDLFSITMNRETVMSDTTFDMILSGKGEPADLADNQVLRLMIRVLPRSYWESERMAYWNTQLNQADHWKSMSFPEGGESLDINPFNVASSFLVPNTARASVQFCYIHSKLSALILECELERYRLLQGAYPDRLDQLVPAYIDSLPEDMMQPQVIGKKPTFKYIKNSKGYLLKSASPVYERVSVAAEQVYGHDGVFEPNR